MKKSIIGLGVVLFLILLSLLWWQSPILECYGGGHHGGYPSGHHSGHTSGGGHGGHPSGGYHRGGRMYSHPGRVGGASDYRRGGSGGWWYGYWPFYYWYPDWVYVNEYPVVESEPQIVLYDPYWRV